ncbi:serine hydrolase domain-containing protein [Antrihabitans cavernicola]|uniref:Beta-lactamase family protein n=1 Tax=Antrihabitans cavernicola TaxID=2495913 RepID=A0A5A7S7U0_9NOCA|nr:serine hydrolase domain-containing protein [Spelaeibacter cavernicola]KAA0017982.1 beta-lactamase family protein [Spelaeibacter cavernicola]
MRLPRVPRLPLVPDPLRRARIPSDVESVISRAAEVDPRSVGMTVDKIEHIWNGVVDLYRGGAHRAIQVCVRRRGQVVLDRSIGHAHGNGPRDKPDDEKVLATTETPFLAYSASKAVTASVVHLLDQRGQIHIGDRVAEYIPEFAKNGKEFITIGQVLAHRAGMPIHPPELMTLDALHDRERILQALCDAKPISRAGKLQAYHALSGGSILGEIVHRVTDKNIRDYLGSEILSPLGFRWTNYGVSLDDVGKVATNYVTGPPALPPVSTMVNRLLGVSTSQAVEMSNDPRFLTSILPAGSVVTTANELSRFFELLRAGGELDGVRIFEPRTIRRAISEQSFLEVDFTLAFPVRYSYGFMLGGKHFSLFGPDTMSTFGHLGYTNILGWADPDRELSVGLITSGKPVIYPEVFSWLGVPARIGASAPKTGSPR